MIDKEGRAPVDIEAERALWRRSQVSEAPQDETAMFLDLAGFAEGRLDTDESERLAALTAADPVAAADVAAARMLGALADGAPAGFERIVGRAVGLVEPQPAGRVIAFGAAARRRVLPYVAQWGSLAAAVVLASWLGFSMGSDFSIDYSETQQSLSGEPDYLPELVDPSAGFLSNFAEDLNS